MKILINYLYAHFWSLSFLCAFVFFAMDMSGIMGPIGYQLYYPMLGLMAIYCLMHGKKVGWVFVAYLGVCLLSYMFNDIPKYYRTTERLIVFAGLLVSFSNLVNSRRIALMRLHLFHTFCILSTILVVINYVMFATGHINSSQASTYQNIGLYTGSTMNNEMGLLGAVSIMFIIAFCGKYIKIFSKIEKIIMLGCLVCAISMMGMASSRMGLICTLLSVVFVLYKLNSKNPKKLLGAAVLFVIGIFVVSSLFGDKFRFMMAKNANQIESADVSSRDATWPFRIIEFKESPVYGVGFARIKYGLGTDIAEELGGTIESGSGWLSVLSQTGLLGAVCILVIVLPNIVYLFRHRSNSYCAAWYSGMCVMFVMQPISEGYITTVGAVLCCLFWLNYSVIDSFRKGVLKEEDLDLSVYEQSRWFDRRLLKIGKTNKKK